MKSQIDQFYGLVRIQEHRRALSRAIIFSLATLVATFLCTQVSFASASNVYITQSGSAAGACTAGVQSVLWLNTPGNWGPSSAQVGPGTVVHLCGVITTPIQVNASGTSGNVIEFLADAGASIQITATTGGGAPCPVSVNNNSYLIFDGGGAGGTNGILEILGNGSGLTTQSPASAFCSTATSGNVEIRNWMIGPLYRHTSLSDTTNSADIQSDVWFSDNGSGLTGNLSIHDNVIHDVGTVYLFENASNTPTISIYNNYIYNDNWALGITPQNSTTAYTLNVHDNHFGSTTNWDTTSDSFHHNGIHFFGKTNVPGTSVNMYNNLVDGDWGNCCSTAFIFSEYTPVISFNFYNNVINQYASNAYPLLEFTGTSTLNGAAFYNNTFQCSQGGNTITALQFAIGSSSITIQNNAFYDCNTFVYFHSGGTAGPIDYNIYMVQAQGSQQAWSAGTGSFAAWQSACSCDSHSAYYPSTDYLNADGTPTASFPGLSGGATPGISLASIATSNLAALAWSTSAGNTSLPTARTVPWTVGAYTGTGSGQPVPPVGLSASVN